MHYFAAGSSFSMSCPCGYGSSSPKDAVDEQLAERRILEIIGMAEGRVEHAGFLCPGELVQAMGSGC